MLTGKSKIRLTFMLVAVISLGTALLSLSYMNRLAQRMEAIANKDARITALGESLSIRMLEARREEKNFIIYFDTLYISQNRRIMEEISHEIELAKSYAEPYAVQLDSIMFLISMYNGFVGRLAESIREDPRMLYRIQRQIVNYEEELRALAEKQRLDRGDLPDWTSDLNLSLLSATSAVSSEKARLFSDLRESSSRIMEFTQEIATEARISLAQHSEEGIQYSIRARRNTQTLLLIAGFLLAYLIIELPRQVFLPFRKTIRSLKALERGDTETQLPNLEAVDEVGELSRAIHSAIQRLRDYNTLRSEKIIEVQRDLTRIIEEVSEGVLILARNGAIVQMNSAARSLFSIEKDSVPTSVKDISPLGDLVFPKLQNVDKEGKQEVPLRINRRGNRKRTVQIIPNGDLDKRLSHVLIIIS